MRHFLLLAAGVAASISATAAQAVIVTNGLTGNTEYDGWVNLTASSGLTTTMLTTGYGSNEAGSGDAVLTRISGFHYPASASLYSFLGDSTFEIADVSLLGDVKTVVFSILTWPNPDFGDGSTPAGSINAGPTLNFNGGAQALPANYVGAAPQGPFSGGGFDVESFAYTFQWDLSSVSDAVTSFDVDWGQIVHTGVLALQLESSDTFSVSKAVAVPEASSLALLAVAAASVLAARLRRRNDVGGALEAS